MSISIIKPIKHTRQKNESPEDAAGLTEFVLEIAKGASSNNNDIKVVANKLENPENIIDNPRSIINQIIASQINIGLEEQNRGKRIYPMTYKFSKEIYKVTVDEAEDMAAKLLAKHEDFQGIAMISENNKDVTISCLFNNYNEDGTNRMTRAFRPYNMSNFYNQNHKS